MLGIGSTLAVLWVLLSNSEVETQDKEISVLENLEIKSDVDLPFTTYLLLSNSVRYYWISSSVLWSSDCAEPFLGVESTYSASLQAAYRLVQCRRGHPPARGVHHDGHVLHRIRVDVHAEFLENAMQGQVGRDIEKEDAFLGCQCGILETPGDSLDCVHVEGHTKYGRTDVQEAFKNDAKVIRVDGYDSKFWRAMTGPWEYLVKS
ncbi:hypothetical protein HETIRDRAFT_102999 [Heterobasidion irregulare TC 32-1]|uniref:Uncharacterized protein n=1 Tax=Heterobasidion irregulare (strain TC 32-1) TaxID=747525 RepID=W4KGK3_HETIT|nr:uncharacterized protein HETIRDRAFT_102999 [Heterobasidion irregulare TC 32-1]ETW84440.1 hypothetical protein HETIRDRAFT_102999 [Heterobasidion irregulare TC 32-1]